MKRIIGLNLILGIWLIVAPFALEYSAGHVAALSNDVAVGLLLVASSLWMLTAPVMPLGAIALESLCGAWLIVAPFALHERALFHALVNNVIVGAIVLLVSLSEAWMVTARRHRAA